MLEKNKTVLEKSRQWWDTHPMTYDWSDKIAEEPGIEYFDLIDLRMREGHWFAQKENQPLFAQLIPYASLKGKRVLEIGCGMGAISQEFARQGALLTAVDLTARAVSMTSRRFQLRKLPASAILQANAEALPFADHQFDYVWSWGVIHCAPNTKKVMSEIRRVLKPGGKTAIMVYNRNSLRNLFRVILPYGILRLKLLGLSLEELENQYSDGTLAKHYTPKNVLELFKDFTDVKLSVYGQRSELFAGYRLLPSFLTFPVEPILRALLRRYGWFLFVEAAAPSQKLPKQ